MGHLPTSTTLSPITGGRAYSSAQNISMKPRRVGLSLFISTAPRTAGQTGLGPARHLRCRGNFRPLGHQARGVTGSPARERMNHGIK